MNRLCKRCGNRPGIMVRVRADGLDGEIIEHTCICHWCRADAARDNAIAISRRTATGRKPL